MSQSNFDSEVYLTEVGRFIVHWAFAESILDLANTVLLHQGGNTIEAQLPKSLDRKLAFFRKVHERLDKFALHAPRVLPVVGVMSELREFRHNITHGIHGNYLTPQQNMRLMRFTYTADNLYATHQVSYAPRDIKQNAEVIKDAGQKILKYVLEIGAPISDRGAGEV